MLLYPLSSVNLRITRRKRSSKQAYLERDNTSYALNVGRTADFLRLPPSGREVEVISVTMYYLDAETSPRLTKLMPWDTKA